ncbi:transketolase [Candidatus Sulfidibacterium hydrothermale]|uniref:transketolase n=1 Tax=Candidatus Sulfidibacterium hydrothermale TaxID=2875962 RepID=UPI001F0B5324|nr:transketolase [Candidatus Sulfidibacterium hydrothermale]UBM61102.1 transketolase [Candidatus Sulfidibacterium hydrothermale]
MALTIEEYNHLLQTAKKLRHEIVEITMKAGGAHIGGGLSVLDILVTLYFKYLNIDPEKPDAPDRDRLVLSKGHAAIAYAPVLAERGFFDKKLLDDFNKFKSPFGMHPDANKIPGCDASTGSLGHGLPIATGMALGARLQEKKFRTYCIVGDGELNEGSNWEAAMTGAHYKLTNLTVFVDRNMQMIDGPVEEIMGLEPLSDKWKAFGWDVLEINGNDIQQVANAIEKAQQATEKPVVIIAKTVKGYGVDFMEDKTQWHYGSLDSELAEKAHHSIDAVYEKLGI